MAEAIHNRSSDREAASGANGDGKSRITTLPHSWVHPSVTPFSIRRRDPTLRQHYLTTALASIPRLLGAVDRNPYRATYGCFDREFWHYRTSSFPCEMYQEGVLPLALVWANELPGNRWHGHPRLRELVVAGLEFSARSCHADGSCDDSSVYLIRREADSTGSNYQKIRLYGPTARTAVFKDQPAP